MYEFLKKLGESATDHAAEQISETGEEWRHKPASRGIGWLLSTIGFLITLLLFAVTLAHFWHDSQIVPDEQNVGAWPKYNK